MQRIFERMHIRVAWELPERSVAVLILANIRWDPLKSGQTSAV